MLLRARGFGGGVLQFRLLEVAFPNQPGVLDLALFQLRGHSHSAEIEFSATLFVVNARAATAVDFTGCSGESFSRDSRLFFQTITALRAGAMLFFALLNFSCSQTNLLCCF